MYIYCTWRESAFKTETCMKVQDVPLIPIYIFRLNIVLAASVILYI